MGRETKRGRRNEGVQAAGLDWVGAGWRRFTDTTFVGMGHGARAHQADEYIVVAGFRDFGKYTVSVLHEWARL
jgi:hypothetical protein